MDRLSKTRSSILSNLISISIGIVIGIAIFILLTRVVVPFIGGLIFPQRTTTFTMDEEVVRVPLVLKNNRYYTYVVVENDTVRMLIDTGATGSFFNYESATKTNRSELFSGGGKFRSVIPIKRIRTMQWGGLTIENLSVGWGTDFNIIGDDILRNFIVQFDNENREIVLTQNSALIEKRGIKVPFTSPNRNVKVSLSINGTEGDFYLDTGYNGELRVDSIFFYTFGLSGLENVRWKGHVGYSLFMPEHLRGKGVSYMTIARHELGGMVFDNAIVTHNIHWHVNVIGYVFLQRFRTFTIDYLNGYVYFELPEDISTSDSLIETVPLAYVNFLRHNINSLGIHFFHQSDVSTVSALLDDGTFTGIIEIGDTLVGIDQRIFNETAFSKLRTNNDLFRLETNNLQRVIALHNASEANEATFHFSKDGEIISIDRVRNRILYPEPKLHGIYPSVALMLQKIEDGYLIVNSITINTDGSKTLHGIRPALPLSDEN